MKKVKLIKSIEVEECVVNEDSKYIEFCLDDINIYDTYNVCHDLKPKIHRAYIEEFLGKGRDEEFAEEVRVLLELDDLEEMIEFLWEETGFGGRGSDQFVEIEKTWKK